LIVGQVRGAHGLRGELQVEILTDDPHRFERLERVFLGKEEAEPTPRLLKGCRLHHGWALLQIEGCDDRTAAEALRGCLVQVPVDEAIPLEEGEFFEHQILGLEVWTVSGELLGSVAEILYTGANDVYVVRRSGPPPREILIPVIASVVLQVDLAAGRLVVELPEGLL
jgi:16S rRNA processing protein RimM